MSRSPSFPATFATVSSVSHACAPPLTCLRRSNGGATPGWLAGENSILHSMCKDSSGDATCIDQVRIWWPCGAPCLGNALTGLDLQCEDAVWGVWVHIALVSCAVLCAVRMA